MRQRRDEGVPREAGPGAPIGAGEDAGSGRRPREGGWHPGRPSTAALLTVLVSLAVVIFIRLRLADVPLERDEGEYAYAGQLILQGIPPYQLVYNMKFPGVYYAYAAILAVFGQTPAGIHTGLLVVNAATILLVFLLGRRLLGDPAAALSSATFALMSVDYWILGLFAHATHFVLPPVLGGILMLLRAFEKRRPLSFVCAGALFGLAVLMKQHAIFFLPLGVALVLWNDLRGEGDGPRAAAAALALMGGGLALVFGGLAACLAAQGVLAKFWFWTFQYAREYVSEMPLSLAALWLGRGISTITTSSFPLWILSLGGLAALWAGEWSGRARVVLTGLFVASLAALCPGFYFRPHYFILVLPAAALLVGVAVVSTGRCLSGILGARRARALALSLFLLAWGYCLWDQRGSFFLWTPRAVSNGRYEFNLFVDAEEVGDYIRTHSLPGDRIAVLGSEPEVYFYARRISATGYIYTYPLMERQKYASWMQGEMIREIEETHPELVVFFKIQASWAKQESSDTRILDWGYRYVRQCYDLTGVADMVSRSRTVYVWGEKAEAYAPVSDSLIMIFRRKSAAPCLVPHAG